jgi:hypothetical protein
LRQPWRLQQLQVPLGVQPLARVLEELVQESRLLQVWCSPGQDGTDLSVEDCRYDQ